MGAPKIIRDNVLQLLEVHIVMFDIRSKKTTFLTKAFSLYQAIGIRPTKLAFDAFESLKAAFEHGFGMNSEVDLYCQLAHLKKQKFSDIVLFENMTQPRAYFIFHARKYLYPQSDQCWLITISNLTEVLDQKELDLKSLRFRTKYFSDKFMLSNREFEIIRLMIFGMSCRQIARNTARSIHTIESHKANIYEKLSVRSKAELFLVVYKHGLLA